MPNEPSPSPTPCPSPLPESESESESEPDSESDPDSDPDSVADPETDGPVPTVAARNKTAAEEHLCAMSCLKGESKAKPKPGRFECDDCGAVVKKKSDVCEPKKIKKKKKKKV